MTSLAGARSESPLTAQELDCRPLYRTLAASVSVITARGAAGPLGMTASSVTAVSLDPPLMAVTLAPGSQTLTAVRLTGRFAVNVLGEEHQSLSTRFAGQRPAWARFAGIPLLDGDLPMLADAVAVAVCTVEWERDCGDRIMVVGRVREAEVSDGAPLLWHGSAYHGVRPLG